MTHNKVPTFQKEEESSSLTSLANQELLFVRRPDIDSLTRLQLGIYGLDPSYRPCTINELCKDFKVSHTFIYSLSKILRKNAGQLFGIKNLEELTKMAQVLQSIRFVLQGKLETQSPHQGLSNLGKDWGGSYTSTNFISQSIKVAGTLLPSTLKSEQPKQLTFLCDEVYSGKHAILVTIEAQSMAVLDIQLLDTPLSSADWAARFKLLEANNLLPSELIKDQGKAMSSAVDVFANTPLIMADTFHAIAHRLGIYYGQLHSRLEKEMAKEEQLKAQVQKAVSAEMWLKQAEKLEAVQTKVVHLLDTLDWFEPAYRLIINQLRPFTSKGEVRDKASAQQAIQFGLEILALLDLKGIEKQVKHIQQLLDNGDLLRFMDKVPALYEKWQQALAPETLWLWMRYWQSWKKSFQTHNPIVQKYAQQEAKAAKELLQEYYTLHPNLQEGAIHEVSFERIRVQLFADLDTIVQASSLVETFNSILKPFIKAARGQVAQPLLNLVMFFHNYRVFNKRCKRGGKAPIELLTGQPLEKNYIDLLMDVIQQAFEKHQVCSLKQLHAILCPKQEQTKKRQKKNKKPFRQQHQNDIITLVPFEIPEPLVIAS